MDTPAIDPTVIIPTNSANVLGHHIDNSSILQNPIVLDIYRLSFHYIPRRFLILAS